MIVLGAVLVLFLWTVTIATGIRLVVPWRAIGHRSPVTFLASLFGALTLTFNFAPVYLAVDRFLGGRNITALLQHTCLILGAFFAMQLLLRSVGQLTTKSNRFLLITLALAIIVQTGAFFKIRQTTTTVDLMLRAHTQPAAFAFSMSHFLYFGVACVVAVSTGNALLRSRRDAAAAVSATAMLIAGVAGILNAAVVVVRDSARLRNDMGFEWLEPYFRGLILTVCVFFCIALSVPAVAGALRRERVARVLNTLERALARSDYDGWTPLRVVGDEDSAGDRDDALRLLNDAVIRLRDGQMIGRGPALTESEEKALQAAERLLGA